MAFFSAALLLTLIRFIKLKQLQPEVVYLKQASVDKIAYCYRSYEILLCLSATVGGNDWLFAILFASHEIEYLIIIIIYALAGGATEAAVTALIKHMV